jgi:hypothetical protein
MKKRLIGIFFALVLIGACVPLARAFADEAGPLDHVVITPVTANITAGGTQQFTAVAEDSNNVTISGLSFIWRAMSPALSPTRSSSRPPRTAPPGALSPR